MMKQIAISLAMVTISSVAMAEPSPNTNTNTAPSNPVSTSAPFVDSRQGNNQIDGNKNQTATLGAVLGNNNQASYTNYGDNTAIVTSNTQTPNTQKIISAPAMSAPMLAVSPQTCYTSASGAISGLGFGIAGGAPIRDTNCELMLQSSKLSSMGMHSASITLLMDNNTAMNQAISISSPETAIGYLKNKVNYLTHRIEALRDEQLDSSKEEAELRTLRVELKTAQKSASLSTINHVQPK